MAEPGTSAANGRVKKDDLGKSPRRPSNAKDGAPGGGEGKGAQKKQKSGLPLRGISETTTETGSATRFISGGSNRSNQSTKRKIPQCTNVTLFAVNYALIILFYAIVDQYFVGMLAHVQKRFHYPKHQLDFISGVEKIGFAVALLFAGYYGNKLHKPMAMCVGALLFCVGSVVCAVPYFIHGEREEKTDANGVPIYILGGLCQSTELREELALINVTLGENQCDDFPYSGSQRTSSFSLLCLGQFAMGVGSSFLATLGLVYIDENARKKDTPLLLGIVLSMRGLGDMMGVLLASKFAEIDEDLGGSIVIWNWDIAAWWLGMPILAGCLFICAVFLPFFPQWIHEPRWLVQRRIRQQQHEERRRKRIEEAIAKRKQRRRQERQRKREREKRRERRRREAEAQETGDADGEQDAGEKPPHYDGDDKKGKAPAKKSSQANNSDKNVVGETSQNGLKKDRTRSAKPEVGEASKKAAGSRSAKPGVERANKTDAEKIQDRSKNKGEGQKTRKNVSISESGNPTGEILSDQSESEARRKRQRAAGSKSGKDENDGATSDATETEAEAEKRRKEEEEEAKRRRKRRLGRRLQDLPKNLWYLLTKVSFTSAVIGATLSAYLRSGFQAALPHFLHVQFHYTEQDSLTISGLTLGAASAVGVFAGGFLVYKKHWSVYNQLKLLLVLTGIVAAASLLLFAVSCDQLRVTTPLDVNDPALLVGGYCGKVCDCRNLQYNPVCSEDGEMYPTPCHAGCQQAVLETDNKYLNFTECGCAASLSAKSCNTECVEMIPYMVISTVMVLAQGMGYVSVIIFFLRIITEKLRSLSLGFAMWLVFLFGYCPGYGVYHAIDEASCEHSEKDCHERTICWVYDGEKYRYMHDGVTAALQTAAILCFLVTWHEVRKMVQNGSRLGLPFDNPLDDIPDDQAASRSKSKKSGTSLDAGGGSREASRDNYPVFSSGTETENENRNQAASAAAIGPSLSQGRDVVRVEDESATRAPVELGKVEHSPAVEPEEVRAGTSDSNEQSSPTIGAYENLSYLHDENNQDDPQGTAVLPDMETEVVYEDEIEDITHM